MDIYHYYVEGECEARLVNLLKSNDMRCIESGKVQVFNPVLETLTELRLRTLKHGTIVILVFDTDTAGVDILRNNILTLKKSRNVKAVYCITQVNNFEEELLYSCNIRGIDELLDTTGVQNFKRQFIGERNLQRKLEAAGFSIVKLWSRKPSGAFSTIVNDAAKIKK